MAVARVGVAAVACRRCHARRLAMVRRRTERGHAYPWRSTTWWKFYQALTTYERGGLGIAAVESIATHAVISQPFALMRERPAKRAPRARGR